MTETCSDIDLCEALSELFVDNKVYYSYIATSVANRFPIENVEKVLPEWVAPVCYNNMLTPAPEIWSGFERDRLWFDIQKTLMLEVDAGLLKKASIYLR